MCLIVLAHRVSPRFPLVIAANRDEEYERPSLPLAFWEGEPAIAGGRDALHGGTWLAVSRSGRFAAVTNLRGSARTTQPRSRGSLVADFVRAGVTPLEYLREVALRVEEYGGFHLLAGVASGTLGLLSGTVAEMQGGIHGLSNAPAGVRLPKVDTAVDGLRGALESTSAAVMVEHLFRLLRTEQAHGDPSRDIFIRGDLYGTRASTVIVVEDDQVTFLEQGFARGGAPLGPRTEVRFTIDPAR